MIQQFQPVFNTSKGKQLPCLPKAAEGPLAACAPWQALFICHLDGLVWNHMDLPSSYGPTFTSFFRFTDSDIF